MALKLSRYFKRALYYLQDFSIGMRLSVFVVSQSAEGNSLGESMARLYLNLT
jgi:hypothetical protein